MDRSRVLRVLVLMLVLTGCERKQEPPAQPPGQPPQASLAAAA